MEDNNLRVGIKKAAIEHFNNYGYHGTTIRNIAREVGCSLPMIYYYYKSKKELFNEIITNDYLALLVRLGKKIKKTDAIGFYTELVNNLNDLSDPDRHLYRLGIKVYMSFDGDEEHIEAMERYEESVYPRHAEILRPHLRDPENCEVIVRTLIHLLDTLIVEIVVKGRTIAREDIEDEISLILCDHLKPGTR